MKKLILAALLVATISTEAAAEYKYDYRTGNSYNTYNSGSNTHVRGNNVNTGSSWNTTIDNNTGNARGFDSQGNSWNYNNSTGNYNNSNGHGCTGKGAGRVCW